MELKIVGIVLAEILCLAGVLWLSRPAWLAFRKRKTGYGVVFNSESGIPEELVTVSVRDLHGQIVRTAITDRQGRYRLLVPPGEYFVDIQKASFVFPSKFLSRKSFSPVYDNLLPGNHIQIKDHGVMTKNIPIDPAQGSRAHVFARTMVLPKSVQYFLAGISPILAVGLAIWMSHWVFWVVAMCYFIFFLNRFTSFKPPQPPFGTVRDAGSNAPLDKVVVRLFDMKFNKLLETQTTSIKGRYAFVVKPGTYRILYDREGYRGVMLNFPKIQKDGYLLARNVTMHKI